LRLSVTIVGTKFELYGCTCDKNKDDEKQNIHEFKNRLALNEKDNQANGNNIQSEHNNEIQKINENINKK
jgi:hypothetical protein